MKIHKKDKPIPVKEPWQNASGKIDYTLTNNYMFHVVLQECQPVLWGLIRSLLRLNDEEIKEITIKNPIVPGEMIENKTFILDILLVMNNNTTINLEMQVENENNWTDRSLSYLCRNFDQLHRGQDYDFVFDTYHIGILDYTLFKDKPEFYAENMMMNIRNHKIFNDKFHLNVLSLNQIHLATEEDKLWSLDLWAKLFKATTWEDLKMIADNNSTMATATKVIYEYNEDELIRRQCRAREEYERHEPVLHYPHDNQIIHNSI